MLEQLLNFLFGRSALQKAQQTGNSQIPQAMQQQSPQYNGQNVGISPMDIVKMAQMQADEELRKKLAAQRAQQLFMGPQQK